MSSPSPQPNSPLPKYVQVIRWLDTALQNQDFRAGQQLPGEAALAHQLGVSTITIRQAFQELTRQGRLIRYPYRGTFVTHTTEAQAAISPASHRPPAFRHKRFLVLVSYCNPDTPIIPRLTGKGRQDQILEAFEKEVSRLGYRCHIKRLIRQETHQELPSNLAAEYDGAFLLADTLPIQKQDHYVNELWNAKIPFIVSDYFGTTPAHCIQESLAQGVDSALSHFETLGLVKPGFLTFDTLTHWGEEWPWLRTRREAYLNGSNRRHWKDADKRIWSISLPKLKKGQYVSIIQEETGTKLARHFLSTPPSKRAKALLAINDRVAIGFLDELKKRDAQTAATISLIGFDNDIVAQSAGLTTVVSPAQEMGVGAANMLFDLVHSAPVRSLRTVDYAPCLLRRDSSNPKRVEAGSEKTRSRRDSNPRYGFNAV